MTSTSTSIAGDDGNQQLPESQQVQQPRRRTQQYKRARTGCERCRARRRKCDEGKPRCKRCIDADAECQYSAHIQFLVKNSWVLSNNTVSSGQSSSVPRPDHAERDNVDPQLLQVPVQEQEQAQEQPFDTSQTNPPAELEAINYENSTSFPDESISNVLENTGFFPRWDEKWPIVGQCSLTDDEVKLLRHFGHFVAPWLDVFDLHRTFGILVPHLAMSSPCIMDGILELSAVSSGAVDVKSTESRAIGPLFFLAMTQLTGGKSTALSALRIIASVLLIKVKIFIQEVPEKWEPCLYGGGIPFGFDKYSFEDPILKRVWNGFIVLISRTEIAYCLIKETAPAMSPDFLRGTISKLPSNGQPMSARDTSQNPLDASVSCLALLADVMTLVYPASEREEGGTVHVDSLATPPTVLSQSTQWKMLLDELFSWYTHRPLELKTLMDIEDREAAFPTILFTSGVGIWANIIYHTAMLLLLNQRPRSISLAEWQKNTIADKGQVSPLWHARRVCGIAVNSNPELTRCWDPCMIASFSIAARRMTHPVQQSSLITCLNDVKSLNWRVDGIVQSLHDEWGTAEL